MPSASCKMPSAAIRAASSCGSASATPWSTIPTGLTPPAEFAYRRAAELAPGTRMGSYRIVRELGLDTKYGFSSAQLKAA